MFTLLSHLDSAPIQCIVPKSRVDKGFPTVVNLRGVDNLCKSRKSLGKTGFKDALLP